MNIGPTNSVEMICSEMGCIATRRHGFQCYPSFLAEVRCAFTSIALSVLLPCQPCGGKQSCNMSLVGQHTRHARSITLRILGSVRMASPRRGVWTLREVGQ